MGKRLVSELEGAELDYWVARALGLSNINKHPNGIWYSYSIDFSGYGELPRYSACWESAGPIIERERISITTHVPGKWYASKEIDGDDWCLGDTPIMAAMRCFVASKFGEYVDCVEM